jgi:integrase/recombinase XerD
MRLRKLAPHTQASYVRAVRRLAGYLRRPPDTATIEDLRNFQLHLVDRGTSPITLNATPFVAMSMSAKSLCAQRRRADLRSVLPETILPVAANST